MKSPGTPSGSHRRLHVSFATALLMVLGVSQRADAQSAAADIKIKKPNALLLLDTSGSMRQALDGTNNYTLAADGKKARWTVLTETLTGTINNLQVDSAGSIVSSGKCEPVANLDKKILKSLLAYGETGSASGAAGPFTWPMVNGNPKDKDAIAFCENDDSRCWSISGWNSANKCRQAAPGDPYVTGEFSQVEDGLIDIYKDKIRFGMASFDGMAAYYAWWGGGPFVDNSPANCQRGTNGSLCVNSGIEQFSYWDNGAGENWLSGTRASYAADTFNNGNAWTFLDIGVNNPRAFPWRGRMIGFGAPDWNLGASGLSSIIDCTNEDECTKRHNEMVQQAVLGGHTALFNSTPLAAMMRDAYEFIVNDTSTQGVQLPHEYSGDISGFGTLYGKLGPMNDPYYTDSVAPCRSTSVILVTDGEPSNDMDVRMSYYAGKLIDEGVNTFVIGVGLATATWNPGGGEETVSCDSLRAADLGPGKICQPGPGKSWMYADVTPNGISNSKKSSIRACCNLLETAVEGGTDRAFFPTNQNELKQKMSQVFGAIAGGAVSRTVPVFGSVSASFSQTGGSTNSPAVSYELRSSMEVSDSSMWTGNLERLRYACVGNAPTIQNFDGTKGDDFGTNLTAAAVRPRKFFTVGTERAAQMTGTIRIPSVNTDDKLFDGGQKGDFRRFSSNDTPVTFANLATQIDGLYSTGTNDTSDLLGLKASDTADCLAELGASSLAQCGDRMLRWYAGDPNPDGGATVSTDPAPSRDPASAQCEGTCSPFGAVYRTIPVIVPPPSTTDSDDQNFGRDRTNGSTSFVEQQKGRPTMVYSQTVDGQLHAFVLSKNDFTPASYYNVGVPNSDALENNELWSFIPPAVVPKLWGNFNSAGRLLDGQLAWGNIVYERALGFDGSDNADTITTWPYNTVLVGCSGAASGLSNSFCYALDVTDPKKPKFLWQLSTAGDSNGDPDKALFGDHVPGAAITHIRYLEEDGLTSRVVAVAIIPGGTDQKPPGGAKDRELDPDTYWDVAASRQPRKKVRDWGSANPARSLTFVELKTGRILARLVGNKNDSPNQIDDEVPGDPAKTLFDSPLTSIPSVFPGGGRVAERVYVGDADGTMWRVELTSPKPDDWEAHIAFDAFNNVGTDSTLRRAWVQTTEAALSSSLSPTPNDNDAGEMGQPIQTAPLLSTDEDGNVVVTFATGNQESFNTVNSGAVNMLVSFTDTFSPVADDPETTGFQAVVDSSKGVEMAWLNGGGVTGPINLFDGQLYFAYFNPSAANTCSLGTGGICGVDYVKRLGSGAPTPSGTADSTDPTAACGDFASGEVVFGISLNLVPSCTVTSSSFSDPWMNGNYNAMTTANGGRYELVFHTGQNGGAGAGGGKTNRTKVELPQPKARTTVRSFVRVAETDQ